MLTIKLIAENTDAVIRGLEKKHFKGAKESIDKVLELNDKRRIAQNQLDKNLAEVNATSKSIGQLMKEGKKEEAYYFRQGEEDHGISRSRSCDPVPCIARCGTCLQRIHYSYRRRGSRLHHASAGKG